MAMLVMWRDCGGGCACRGSAEASAAVEATAASTPTPQPAAPSSSLTSEDQELIASVKSIAASLAAAADAPTVGRGGAANAADDVEHVVDLSV